MSMDIDWEGAYRAWKESKLSRRRFQLSRQFRTFIHDGSTPSEDTVRTHFRRIRDRLLSLEEEPESDLEIEAQVTEADPIEIGNLDAVRVKKLAAEDIAHVCLKKAAGRPCNNRRSRKVIVRLNDGRQIEFETNNPELFVLKALQVSGVAA